MTKKINIIADDKIPFLKGVLEPFADVTYLAPSRIVKEVVKSSDALIIRTRTKCNAELLSNSNVKFIATATIGLDHIDVGYCESQGIKWVNAPGCNSSSVQQYIASALVTLAKLKNFQLDSMTIGIVGVGNVGSKVAKIANILGMRVLFNDPPRERSEGEENFVSLNYLIKESDIITFHVPLNVNGIDKTFHLADDEFFRKFGNDKIFINTSRGEVVESIALKKAISEGKVAAAVLDVWENEPDIDLELLDMITVATPHIAGYSSDGKANGTAVCVNAINEYYNLRIEGNWYPKHIPLPNKSKEIIIDCLRKSKQEIFYDCIHSTYNIMEDYNRLRNSISDFEKQRAEYPVRREFNYFDVHLNNANESITAAIGELGFNVQIK